jgi:hypothetical protein
VEAKDKIYYIGHHVNQAPNLFLKGVDLNSLTNKIIGNKINPDGFFVSNRIKKLMQKRDGKVNAVWWLLKQNLHKSILKGIRNGDIVIGNNLSKFNLVVPYWITNKDQFTNTLHNSGEGYSISSEDLKLEEVQGREGVKKIDSGALLFKWNDSSDQNAFCSTGAIVNLKKIKTNYYQLDIKVIGGAISQISPWVSPNWTQSWLQPYVEVSCQNIIKRFPIIDSIGFRRIYTHYSYTPFFSGNNSLVGPLAKTIEFSCNGPIQSVSIGRKGSAIEKITKVSFLGPKSLIYNYDLKDRF